MTLKTGGRYLLGLIISAVGFGLGIVGSQIATADAPSTPETRKPHVFQINESGQTFGSGLDAVSPSNQPDLVEAYGADGRVGYVRSADLYVAPPRNPNEAVARQRAGVGGSRAIPLLAQDGATVIGSFQVNRGAVTRVVR